MGIFVKFECDTCGEYECDHTPEERNKKYPIVKMEHKVFFPNKQYEELRAGDIICRNLNEDVTVDEAVVLSFSDKGFPIVKFTNDAQYEEWKGNYIKISSIKLI